MQWVDKQATSITVAPVRERGLKLKSENEKDYSQLVAPARERGLKYQLAFTIVNTVKVAPARERGLKCLDLRRWRNFGRRSREGAWIEIAVSSSICFLCLGRSREGAWIEIANLCFSISSSPSLPRGSVD